MKKAILFSLLGAAVLGGALYYFLVYKKKSTDNADTPTSTLDDQYLQKMISAFEASKYKNEMVYVLNEYNANYAPGQSNQPNDEYSLVAGKATKTAGLLKAIWTAWKGSHENEPEAKKLLQDVAKIYEEFKYKRLKELSSGIK